VLKVAFIDAAREVIKAVPSADANKNDIEVIF
jgi:hypothetical protein